MKISSIGSQNLASIQQAFSMANLQAAMNRDEGTVDGLMEGMEEHSEAIQKLAEAHKGTVIDIQV